MVFMRTPCITLAVPAVPAVEALMCMAGKVELAAQLNPGAESGEHLERADVLQTAGGLARLADCANTQESLHGHPTPELCTHLNANLDACASACHLAHWLCSARAPVGSESMPTWSSSYSHVCWQSASTALKAYGASSLGALLM